MARSGAATWRPHTKILSFAYEVDRSAGRLLLRKGLAR